MSQQVRKSRWETIFSVVIAGLILMLLQATLSMAQRLSEQKQQAAESGPALGSNVGEISLAQLDGSVFTANAPFEQPVLLYFALEGCPHCAKMTPVVNEIAVQHGESLQIVAAGVGNTPEGIETELGLLRPNAVVLYDEGATIARRLNVNSFPMLVLMDITGVVRWKAIGAGVLSSEALWKQIERALPREARLD